MSQSVDREFQDRTEWREWLEKNHSSEREVWVIIQKKKSSREGLKYEEAVEEAICFGWIDSKMQSIDAESFRQRFTPRTKDSVWSKKNKDTALRMVEEEKMTEVGYRSIEDAKESGKWEIAYSSIVAPTIPNILEEALKENQQAWDNFNRFSNSAKLQYIYWIFNSKREETRQKRIQEVVKKAKQNIKPQ